MSFFNPKLAEVVQRNPKYAYEAYEFVFQGLNYAQKLLGREPPREKPDQEDAEQKYHVSGPEWLQGIRALALRELGLMARTVFHMWGVERTDDYGEIVFTLIDAVMVSKKGEDRRVECLCVMDMDE